MALEGPQLRFARLEGTASDDRLKRALRLAREVEELLEESPSSADASATSAAHSTRMATAMAASLVDELEALVVGRRKSGVA